MKKNVPMVCNVISFGFIIALVIKVIVVYTQYTSTLNSAPFYLWMLVDALFLVWPASIVFAIGKITKKKQ